MMPESAGRTVTTSDHATRFARNDPQNFVFWCCVLTFGEVRSKKGPLLIVWSNS